MGLCTSPAVLLEGRSVVLLATYKKQRLLVRHCCQVGAKEVLSNVQVAVVVYLDPVPRFEPQFEFVLLSGTRAVA